MEDPDDLQRGLKTANDLAQAARKDVLELAKEVYTLLEVLVQRGAIRLSDLRGRYPVVAARLDEEAKKKTPLVEIGDYGDKYTLSDLPEIDCETRIPLCKAKCCTLSFRLSAQDLDEGVVRWDLAHPYRIRQRDGYCAHIDPATKGCGVYQHRPAPCRIFDCREDARIWLDFEARIPAPEPEPEAS